MFSFDMESSHQHSPLTRIKVVGVGGAGGNSVNTIMDAACEYIECIAINTDAQALKLSKSPLKIQIGTKSTKGLGTGANPELGRKAAEEDLDTIHSFLGEADIVFLVGGLGGGTGSGALPVIARHLRQQNILTIALVTRPFIFEGKRRAAVADKALLELEKEVDTLLVVPNQKLLACADTKISLMDGFKQINDIIVQCVRSIADTIMRPGYINVDFADVRSIMKDKGLAVMGIGMAHGPERAAQATKAAISSPLLENIDIKGAQAVLVNIAGSRSLGLHEVSNAASLIYEQVDADANIILGTVVDETLEDALKITVIATGFKQNNQVQPEVVKPSAMVQEVPVEQTLSLKASLKEEGAVNLQDLEVPTALRKMILARQAQQQK